MDRPTNPSGRHAVRLRWDEIITRLSYRFNFLAIRDHMRAARGVANLYQFSPQGLPCNRPQTKDGMRCRSSHGAFRPLLDIWALKSSILERNSFRIGDLFALL